MMKKLLLAGALTLACSPAFAANNISVKDSANVTTTVCSKDIGGGVQSTCHTAVDSTGAEINDTTLHAQKVVVQPGENHIGEIGGRTVIAGCASSPCFTTTSATTAWSSGQIIGDSTTAASVTRMSFVVCRIAGGTGMIRRARVKVANDTGFVGASVVLYLYRDSPTLTNGDRGAWLTTESNYLGRIPVLLNNHFSDYEKGVGVPIDSNNNVTEINYDCASGVQVLYGLLVANGTITPAAGSKAVTVVLEALVN